MTGIGEGVFDTLTISYEARRARQITAWTPTRRTRDVGFLSAMCRCSLALSWKTCSHEDDASDADQGKHEQVVVGIGDWAPTHQLLLLAAIRADKDRDRWWLKFLEL